MPGNPPNIIRLYRIVHLQNVRYILENGIYIKESPHADPNYIDIGDKLLIDQRREYPVKLPGYGNMGEYIPFYFAGHSPMLLNIKTGYRGITKRPQHEIVYIVCKLDDILTHCNQWFFTDGHAKNNLSNHLNDLSDLDKIDWDMVRKKYWGPTEDDYDRQRRKQAEFLVKNHVPVACIESIVVKDNLRSQIIEEIVQEFNLSTNVFVDTQNRLYYD